MTTPRPMSARVQNPPTPLDLNKAVVNTQGLRAALKVGWKTISGSLPKHMEEERFFNLVLGQAVKDSGVFRCTGLSILNALQQAASLGLEVNAASGEAYLIPFNDRQKGVTIATLVPGYKGLAKLALQSPQVLAVSARLVYEGEKYEVYYGTRDEIDHRPNFDLERTPEKVVAAYAIAKMQGGAVQFEVMTRKQLDLLKKRSLQKTDGKGPWATDEEEMQRKTPFRRLCKYLPLTSQLAEAIELADRAETGDHTSTKGRSAMSDALNNATTAALSDRCVKGCKVADGIVWHDPECPLFADGDHEEAHRTPEGA